MPGKYYTYPKLTAGLLCAIVFILGTMFGATSVRNSWTLDAASTECAQFNPENGQFEWIPEILEIPHRKSKID